MALVPRRGARRRARDRLQVHGRARAARAGAGDRARLRGAARPARGGDRARRAGRRDAADVLRHQPVLLPRLRHRPAPAARAGRARRQPGQVRPAGRQRAALLPRQPRLGLRLRGGRRGAGRRGAARAARPHPARDPADLPGRAVPLPELPVALLRPLAAAGLPGARAARRLRLHARLRLGPGADPALALGDPRRRRRPAAVAAARRRRALDGGAGQHRHARDRAPVARRALAPRPAGGDRARGARPLPVPDHRRPPAQHARRPVRQRVHPRHARGARRVRPDAEPRAARPLPPPRLLHGDDVRADPRPRRGVRRSARARLLPPARAGVRPAVRGQPLPGGRVPAAVQLRPQLQLLLAGLRAARARRRGSTGCATAASATGRRRRERDRPARRRALARRDPACSRSRCGSGTCATGCRSPTTPTRPSTSSRRRPGCSPAASTRATTRTRRRSPTCSTSCSGSATWTSATTSPRAPSRCSSPRASWWR